MRNFLPGTLLFLSLSAQAQLSVPFTLLSPADAAGLNFRVEILVLNINVRELPIFVAFDPSAASCSVTRAYVDAIAADGLTLFGGDIIDNSGVFNFQLSAETIQNSTIGFNCDPGNPATPNPYYKMRLRDYLN